MRIGCTYCQHHTHIHAGPTHRRVVHILRRHRSDVREREDDADEHRPDDAGDVCNPTKSTSHIEGAGSEDNLRVSAIPSPSVPTAQHHTPIRRAGHAQEDGDDVRAVQRNRAQTEDGVGGDRTCEVEQARQDAQDRRGPDGQQRGLSPRRDLRQQTAVRKTCTELVIPGCNRKNEEHKPRSRLNA
jgi:hypothetical protein